MDTARWDKQPFPESWASFEWMHNHREPGCGPTGPKPPAQLLPEAQKAKRVPMVSVGYKWHVVNTDAQSPILPAGMKTV